MKYAAFVLCVVFYIVEAEAGSRSRERCYPQCPAGMPTTKFSPQQIAAQKKTTVEKLWATPIPLTNDTRLLSSQFISMANSTSPNWQNFASVASFWIWTYLPTLNTVPPNFCMFAQIVNNTPSWYETGSCSGLKAPLQEAVDQIQYGTMIIISRGLANTGCGKLITEPKGKLKILPLTSREKGGDPLKQFANTKKCYADGKIYDIESMLNYMDETYSNVPWASEDMKDILLRMYNSKDRQDNLVALMTLAAASRPLNYLVTNYRNEMKFTFFSLGCCSKLPPQCCGKYRHDMKHIYSESMLENKKIFNETITRFC